MTGNLIRNKQRPEGTGIFKVPGKGEQKTPINPEFCNKRKICFENGRDLGIWD